MNNMMVWLRLATPEEREALALASGTPLNYLYHLAAEGKSYQRVASSEKAAAIETAAKPINAKALRAGRTLPDLLRTDLSPVCRECVYARKCLGEKAVASEFSYLARESATLEEDHY